MGVNLYGGCQMAGGTTGRTSSGDQQSYQKSFFGQSVVIMIWNLNRTQEKYDYSKQTVLYEAVKQGAFARYFDQKKLGMYLMKNYIFLLEKICFCLLLDYAWMLQ